VMGKICRVKKETHAARWGLMRGYSGKATKWVDFAVTDSTRRESCHLVRVEGIGDGVKGHGGKMGTRRVRFWEADGMLKVHRGPLSLARVWVKCERPQGLRRSACLAALESTSLRRV